MRPPSLDQEWPSSSHLQDPLLRSPLPPRHNAMLSTLDTSQSSSHHQVGPKPPIYLHTLPDSMPTPYGHRYSSENPHPAPNDDSRSSPIHYQPYPNHRHPPQPYHHYPSIHSPSHLIHDHRFELRHAQSHFPQQSLRQSNHSIHDSHPLSSQSPSDPDHKRLYRTHPHHQSPSYETHFPHPSQKRPHGSPDPSSHLSPPGSLHPLPHHASRPSTSSSSHAHQPVPTSIPQKSRHSYATEPPSISPDQQPRLYQPQPRRIPQPSSDLRPSSSPRHQSLDPYPTQTSAERPSQPSMPCPPPHPHRSHPHTSPSAPSKKEDDHLNSPRLHDQHHLSMRVFPHHRNSHSVEHADHVPPSPQSRIQSLYIQESPRFQHSSDYPTYEGSVSRRQENVHKERSQQLVPSHPLESSSHSTFPEDRMPYSPENIHVRALTYHPRDHLSNSMAIQMHPSHSTSAHRQHLQPNCEQQQDPRRGQAQSRLMEFPSRTSYNSAPTSIHKVLDGHPRAFSPQDPQAIHRTALHQPSPHLHDHKKTRLIDQNHPGSQSKPSKFDSAGASLRFETPSTWPPQISSALQPDLHPSHLSDPPSSCQPDLDHDRPSKSRKISQSGPPRPQVPCGPSPINHPTPVTQTSVSTDLSQFKSPPVQRTPSPRSNPNDSVINKHSAPDHPSPSSSRPPVSQKGPAGHGDREISTAPSCTEDEVPDDGTDDGVIRCICSFTTDDGFTIQCEMCEVWQHAICVNVPIDEVPEHYFCDQRDPLPERRRQLIQMAPQAERIQRQRLKKEAEVRSQERQADQSPSASQGSLHILNQIGPEEQDGSLVDSPAASTSMSRVGSGVCVSESVGLEAPGQSPIGYMKGKGKANASNHLDKLQTTLYTDNGLGLSGLQESPTSITNSRPEDFSLIRDPIPRKPGRKPAKFNQSKSNFSKASVDPPISCTSANTALESDSIPTQNNTDADDRYEAWRYEYTPTLKDLYLDADVKYHVDKLIAQYFEGSCGDESLNGLDSEIPGPDADQVDKPAKKPSLAPTELGKPPALLPTRPISPPSNHVDSIVKPQRATPHSFGNTQFLPVTMSELPPPLKLTIKAIPPSAINFFPSLTTNPFCPTFSNSLSNSSTSSLPRLITHGVFSAQPISRGSYIASLKGSITSVKKYTRDVFSQYDTLGCNKPYVKFFKSTRLTNCLLRSQELGQIDDGLVIDSRQYGNEMRFIRNGCHPNAFINIIMTPQAPRLQNPEFPKALDSSRVQATSNRPHPPAHEDINGRKHFSISTGEPWSVAGSSMNRDLHLPWEVSFGVFAASDISRREEIILPWDWDDQHLVHMLPRLLSHSSTFEIQQQQRSPPLPPVRSQFLPWSLSDLKLLSRKLAAVTLTLFGLMFCGCEKKKSCAINLMWKMGCLSAGEPMFPNDQQLSHGDQQASEILPISSLKERQEVNLPLTLEEKCRLVLHSFLEQPNHLASKVGRNLNSNVNALGTGRHKKHKVDLGPLLGLRRDWWNYSPGEHAHTHTSQMVKAIARKQKRPRSRSVFNRNPSVNKIRRVSDIGETRRNGLIIPTDNNDGVIPKDNNDGVIPKNNNDGVIPQDNNDGVKYSAVTVTEASTTEHKSPHTVAHTDQSTSGAVQQSDPPSQSNELNNNLASVPLRDSLEIYPQSDADDAQSREAIEIDRRDNKLFQLVAPGVKLFANNLINQGTDLVNLESGPARESGEVCKHQISLLHDEDTPIPAHVSSPAISECADLSSGKVNIEDAQSKQVVEEVVTHTICRKVTSRENSEAESLVTASHQFPHQVPTTSQIPVTAQVRFDPSDHAASGVSEEGELANVEKVTEDQTFGAGRVHEHETLPCPSHIHPVPNEESVRHEIGLINRMSAQFASISDSVQSLAERRSPRRILAPSPHESSPLGRATETCDPDEDWPEIDTCQVRPASDVKSELTVTQQTEVDSQGPSLSANEVTSSFHNEHLPIRMAEPPDQSFQKVGTASVAEVSSSQSVSMDVDVYQRGLRTENETENATDQLDQFVEEQKPFNAVPLAELMQSPEVLVAPLESESSALRQSHSPSRTSPQSPSVSYESEFEAQDESILSHSSDEESLLDSDASTTILGSSDEEMLSSHTPRYLNNRKRIRSKNIIKSLVRAGAVNKNHKLDPPRVERHIGLTTNGTTRSLKPESRSADKPGNSSAAHKKENETSDKASSMSSNLDSEEDVCAIFSKTAPRESGSKMRLTIRSSSPFDDDDAVTLRPQHRTRISSTPQSSSASNPAQSSPVNTGVFAMNKSASPCLLSAPIQPVPPSESYSHGASQNAPVIGSGVLSKPSGSSDSYPPVSSKTDREEHATIVPEKPTETRASLTNGHVAVLADVDDLKRGLAGAKSTTCISIPGALENSTPKSTCNSPPDGPNPIQTSSEENTHPQHSDLKNHDPDETMAAQPVKQPPKRISLKDYRSRKVGDSVPVTPRTNPVVQFSTVRPPQTSCNEASQRKQPPQPIIPALPPLLPPTQQSQPLLPLSPRKLELVASVLKKEDKDRASLKDVETGSTPNFIEIQLPPPSTHNDSTLTPTVYQDNQDPVPPAVDQTGSVLEFKLPRETDLPDKTCKESGNPPVSGLEDSKASGDDADVELLEDDIDGVAIESASNPSEDGFEDDGKQSSGLEISRTDPPPEEKDVALMSPSPTEAVQAPIPDPHDKSPVLEEQLQEMKVDTGCDHLNASTLEPDDPFTPSIVPRASSENHDRSVCSPAPESNHHEDSTTLEQNINPVQNKELDLDDSPDDTIAPRAPPRPRLSLAAYRQRLAAARSSTSEEPHQSQCSSPFLPDLGLVKVTPDPSTSLPPSHQSIPISPKQEQLDAGASQSDTPSTPVISNQVRNLSETPLTQSLESGLEPKISNATSTDPGPNSEAASELRPSDATMYFPPISPSILMAEEESPRSPQLKSSPSPAPLSQGVHGDIPLLSSSPGLKLGGRAPLESAPVPSTSNLEFDVKGSPTNQPSIPRVITEPTSQPSDIDPKSLGQSTTSPTPTSSKKQSVSHQPSPSKCTSHTSLDLSQSSPSMHTCPLPVPIPSHPIVNRPRKLIPSSSVGPSSSYPTPIPPHAPIPQIQTPESTSHNNPRDQSLPPSSSRLLAGSSVQRSPTIPLSPQIYHSSVSPASPVPGASEPRSSPRGSSNFLLGSNRGGHFRVSNRSPHNSNCSSAPLRPSWPPESSTTSNNDNLKSTTETLSGPSMANTSTGAQNTSKNLPEIPSTSLPVTPNHDGIGWMPRNNHPSYHHLPRHRTTPFFPPMRNFPDHRTASMPMMETSGPGPPSSQFRPPPNSNGGTERSRYDGLHRTQVGTRSPSPYPPHRGRAKVRGTGQSYWSIDNSSSGANSNGRNFGNGPRNDR